MSTSAATDLAPIGLSVYARLEHVRKTVTALKANTLARQSVLYVFSDGPKPGHEEKVAQMREFLRTIDGFRDVVIVERESNSRIANNRGGQRQLIEAYGKMIFMEEDIVTAPGFLEFVNRGLDFYAGNPRVFSITGYTAPLKLPPTFNRDSFALSRFNAWGFGIWKDRYDSIKQVTESELLSMNRMQLARNGEDLYQMVLSDARGALNALDVRAVFFQAKSGMVTIFPRQSLVENIGHDGTGIHCRATQRFHHDVLWDRQSDFVFDDDVQEHEMIRMLQYLFRSCP